MALFEVKNLSKIFDSDGTKTFAVNDVSFSIEKGEFVSIMGPSGSGKSTLLHILGFLSDYTSGSYKLNGKESSEYIDEELARVRNEELGFVFQSFNLLGRSTVYENVRLPLVYSRRDESEWDKRIRDAVEAVSLTHRLDYETSKLSGGEKQRVAIARALVNDPKVIFADEPTGNLDSASGKAVIETLEHLHEKMGHTIILITHETQTAMHARRIIYIRDGRIESDAPVDKRATIFNK